MEFEYKAKNREGKEVENVISAPSRDAAGQLLRQQGLLPTSLVQKHERWFDFEKLKRSVGHVSLLDKMTFIKNLAVTIKAGLPISKALHVVSDQMSNAYFRGIIGGIAHEVETGQTLSESMEQYPRVFSPIFVNMVSAGEQSGQLDKNLDYLATQVSRDYHLIRRTKGALMYPAVVVVALLGIGYIMFSYVLPKLTETFKQFDVELPILTKVIISVVDLFANYSILILVIFAAFIGGLWFWSKTESGQQAVHYLMLKIPVIGKIVKKINLARFTIIFSGLLKSGMSIVEALSVSADTLGNIHYQAALKEASEKVKIGINLRAALEKYPNLFTPMVTQMVQVGEESGTMEDTLAEVANFYEAEIDDSVKNLSSIIEPVLVMGIGIVVGLLAVGLILPIYNIGTGM